MAGPQVRLVAHFSERKCPLKTEESWGPRATRPDDAPHLPSTSSQVSKSCCTTRLGGPDPYTFSSSLEKAYPVARSNAAAPTNCALRLLALRGAGRRICPSRRIQPHLLKSVLLWVAGQLHWPPRPCMTRAARRQKHMPAEAFARGIGVCLLTSTEGVRRGCGRLALIPQVRPSCRAANRVGGAP